MSYVIGIDLGTGSVKGLVVNKKGTVVLEASEPYPLFHIKKGYSEQDPADWLHATETILKKLIAKMPELKEQLQGISFSGQMHSLVLLDEKQQPLRNAILWNDVRTTKQCEEITQKLGKRLVEKTKNLALEGFTLPKILWIKEHEPEIWAKAKSFLLPKDYLAFWLTGNQQMECSDAAGTLLLNVMDKQWDMEIAETFGIDRTLLPSLVSSLENIGTVNPVLAKELGLKTDVCVFAGGADNACAALGAGIVEENRGMCSIGTSGVFLSYEGEQEKDYQGKLHFFNHVIPNTYYSMGVTLAAGQSLTWFRETFAKEQTFEALVASSKNSTIGANGLLFTPYIMGERTPHVDSKIRGSFIGMDASHVISDFTRAVLEGITFSLKDSQVMMQTIAGKQFQEIVSVGGGAKSELWLQIQADIFNAKIVTLKTEQGPGLGAAMIAAVGVGWFATVKECAKQFVVYDKEYFPNEEAVASYQAVYELYREIYNQTKTLCHRLNEALN
ncbi:xylulose kinase [Enterococcus silesiacus]|uniref:Xylulose kinase n=1 Tax=Enterococcus silesiacus TaxID=332949 RepID=A0A0S3KC56_9ENTE|nr:xylulokinase [Enterococcus silesiacus]ALS01836.1 xylulose kinase [Enterococcus silesiacus]OJG92096.1 xylulose kinase [Enterococcus silesiacus]